MKAKITQDLIDRLECPGDVAELTIYDTEQRGLLLRVFLSGAKSFWCRYSVGGRKTKFRLGDASIGPKAARDAVKKAMGELAQGRDPAGERKEKRAAAQLKADEQAFTLRTLIDRWAAIGLKDKRASYRDEAQRALKVGLASHLDRGAADLTDRATLKRKSELLEAEKDAVAAALLRYGHACYAWAISERLLAANPFAGVKKPSIASRDHVLADEELALIWKATAGPGSFNAIVRMLMISGQRRSEVAGMGWGELSADLSTWTIPAHRAKNGAANVVPLSAPARQIIGAALRREGVDLVFAGERGEFRGFGHSKAALDKASKVEGWRLHDLRRTCATNLQKLGVRLEVCEGILNHISGTRAGVAGVYRRYDYADEKRAALDAWGERLAAIVEGRPVASNVVPLRA